LPSSWYVIEFNVGDQANPRSRLEFPSQRFLEYHLSAIPDSEFDRKLALVRDKAQKAITDMLAVYDIDAVVGLADARIQSLASLAGYAVGAMPLGYSKFNGRAWGMAIITGARGEGKMLEIMSAWESTFGDKWKPPPLLEFWASNGNR
jgi:amidase